MRTLNEIASDLEFAVEAMEESENAHWLRIGALLNEGRAQFRSDEKFGQWVERVCCNLQQTDPYRNLRAAATEARVAARRISKLLGK